MNNLKDTIKKARNGNKKARKTIVDNYRENFKKMVIFYCGEDYAKNSDKYLKVLIDKYLDENYRTRLNDFLNNYVKLIPQKGCIDFKNLKDLINDGSKESIKYLIEYYKKDFINIVRKNSKILNSLEINLFVNLYLNKCIERRLNTCKNYNSFLDSMYMKKVEFERFYNCEENILRRYALLIDNDKVIKYFSKKYKYVLDKHKNTRYYNELINYYEECIKLTLKCDIRSNFESNLSSELENKKRIIYDKLNNIEGKEKENLDIENYLFIKDQFFNKFRGLLPDLELKSLIDIKFNELFEKYKNNNFDSTLIKYLNCYLNMYLKNYKQRKIKKEFNTNELTEEILNNSYIFYNYKKYHNGYYSYDEIIYKEYVDLCGKSIYNKKEDKEAYLTRALRSKITKYNELYNKNYLENLVSLYKEKNLINKDIEDEIFNGFIDFYINNEIYNNILFEKYLFNSIRYFDEEKYKQLKGELNEFKQDNKKYKFK